jgi:hypothetical protein
MHLYRELLDPCVNSFTYGTNLFHGVKPAAALSAEMKAAPELAAEPIRSRRAVAPGLASPGA